MLQAIEITKDLQENVKRSRLLFMATDQQKQDRIDEIDVILSTGMTAHSFNGVSMSFDPSTLRKERARLQKDLDSGSLNSSIDISGAFG